MTHKKSQNPLDKVFAGTRKNQPKGAQANARLPDEMGERIKREISVERLVEARGIKLKRVGKNLVGLCPFHKEQKPSLTITPSTNKWRCFECGKGGTVFDWVMHTEGISFSHALELLRRDLVPLNPHAGPPVKISTVPKLPPLISQTNDDKKLLEKQHCS